MKRPMSVLDFGNSNKQVDKLDQHCIKFSMSHEELHEVFKCFEHISPPCT